MIDDNQAGPAILVIEDEVLIAFMLEDFLAEAGHSMVGPCGTLAEAHAALGRGGFDAALVDLTLPDGSTEAVIEELTARAIPFAIMSGRSDDHLARNAAGVLTKPFTYEELTATLSALGQAHAKGAGD